MDEFALKVLHEFDGKEFKSVSAGDLGFEETEEEKKEDEAQEKESRELFTFIGEALSGKVKAVRASKRLKSHPVCLSSDGELSLEMEKVLSHAHRREGEGRTGTEINEGPSHLRYPDPPV